MTITFLSNKISEKILLYINVYDSLGVGFRELQRRLGETNYKSYHYCVSKLRAYNVITTTSKGRKIRLTEKGRNAVTMGLIPTLLWQIDEQIKKKNTSIRALEKKKNRYDNIRRRKDLEKQQRLIRLYHIILSSCTLEHHGTPWFEEYDAEQLAKCLDAISVKSVAELEKIGEFRPDINHRYRSYTCYCNPEFPYIIVERKQIPILQWSHKYGSESKPEPAAIAENLMDSNNNFKDDPKIPLYLKVLDQFEKNYEREAREAAARIPPANRPISVVRYRFSVLGVSKGSLSSYRYPDSLQSDIAFSSDEIEKALRSLTLLHIIEPRLCLPDGEILYFITDKYDQLISFAHDCLDLEYIITEMVEKLLINGENRRRKKLKEAAFNWFESSRGKKYCDGKLRELYHAVQSVDFNHNNCGLNKNELIYNYYFAPNLFRIACKAIRYIEEKHKDLLEEYNYLTEPMLNAAHYRPLLEAVNSISGISDGKCIKYPIQKSKEMELKSKLYVGMKLSDAYKILAENDVPNAHHNTVLFGNLGFSTSPITDDSYQEFRLVNKRRKKAKKSHLMYPWMN